MIRQELIEAFNKNFELNSFVRLTRNIMCLKDAGYHSYELKVNSEGMVVLLVSVEEFHGYGDDKGNLCINFIDDNFVLRKSGFFSSVDQFKVFFKRI